MGRLPVFVGLFFICFVACDFSLAAEKEKPIKSRVATIGVFKNGVLVVQEEVLFPEPGRYVLESPPAPIHGTFFIEGHADITVTSKLRMLPLPYDQIDDFDWRGDFAGKKVRITLENSEPFDAEICVQGTSTESHARSTAGYRSFSSSYVPIEHGYARSNEKQILLKKSDGSIVVIPNKDCVTRVELKEGSALAVRKRPVILFDVPQSKTKESVPVKLSFSYLTKGMTWAPSWQMNASSSEKIAVSQTALLVNQWRSFEEVSVFLISGYPQIVMNGVPSPLDPSVSLEYFFERLSATDENRHRPFPGVSQQIMMNVAVPSPQASNEPDLPSAPAGEGPDLVFQPAGKLSLEKGDRLLLSPVAKEASCERFVYWNIPDDRDEWGRNDESRRDRNHYGRTTSGEMERSGFLRFVEPWDVWEFVNPFDFPMTTGPATVSDKNRFVGQSLSFWTNVGQKNSLAINKALSILVQSREEEVAPATTVATKSTPVAETKSSTKLTGSATGNQLLETIRQNTGTAILGNRLPSLPALPPGVDFKKVSTDSEGRATVVVNGRSYRIATVKATIDLTNHRKEKVRTVVRRRFSGELVRSEATLGESLPGSTIVLAREQSGINRRQETSWNFVLAPGEKKTVLFYYQVLILL